MFTKVETKEIALEMKGLFSFDWDETILSKHMNKIILQAFNIHNKKDIEAMLALPNIEEKIWAIASQIEPRGKATEWKALFEKLIEDNHHISIATYGQFPELIRRYLKDKINLSEDVVSKIHIVCYMYPSDVGNGKNRHIEESIAHFKRDKNNTIVVLVEDSQENLDAAVSAGKLHPNGAVLAPKDEKDQSPTNPNMFITTPHISKVLELSEQLKKEISIYQAVAKTQSEKSLFGNTLCTFKPAPKAQEEAQQPEALQINSANLT
ncbi:MAG: hypothetical protein QM652_00630 [Legionella sp.]|uniref:hypothetical protein n=1 Tax=Legionella sp. TaxID=459 RepID=UPI0039E6276D